MRVSIYDKEGIETGVEFQNVKTVINNEDKILDVFGYISSVGYIYNCGLLEPHVEADVFDDQNLLCFTYLGKQIGAFWPMQKATFHISLTHKQFEHMVSWDEANLILRIVYLKN